MSDIQSEPQDGAALLARIKPRLNEDWRELVLRPDLVVAFEELKSDLEASHVQDITEAAKAPERGEGEKRMGERPAPVDPDAPSEKTIALAQQLESLREEMIASAVKFTFRALPRDRFRALCDNHPPRKGDQFDAYAGYNRLDLGDALVRSCLVDPVFDDASWNQLLDVLGPGQWQELQKLVEELNGSVVHEAPKSRLASEILSPRASDSAPQPASE